MVLRLNKLNHREQILVTISEQQKKWIVDEVILLAEIEN